MGRDHSFLPFVAVLLGIAAFSAMDAAMKSAATAAGVYTALVLRNLFGTLMIAPVWFASGRPRPSPGGMKVHLTRSAITAAMAVLFFYGLVRVPLAEAIAISFIAPLIALYLASLFLGETIRPNAVIASLLGLAGVIVIAAARFGDGHYDAEAARGIAAILVSAVFYAANLVLQRKQALLAGPVEIALVQNAFVAGIYLVAAPWLLGWPEPDALRDIALSALLATIALLFLAWGYARAEAQVLVPIEYTGFGWAALFGWLWFGEHVSAATALGAVLIVAGCWIAARKSTAQSAV